ncbi:MAG: hypothetical protein WCG02_03255 [Candidatus Taylorbacteria bacterium]
MTTPLIDAAQMADSIPTTGTILPEDILGLSAAEKRIIQVTSKMAIGMSQISKKAKIPRSSVPYMLEKLKVRGFIKSSTDLRLKKKKVWRSDITQPIKSLGNIKKSSFVGGRDVTDIGRSVVTYHGAGHILDIFYKMTELPKNSRIIAFQPDSSVRYALRKNLLSNLLKINEDIKRKALIVEGIVHEKSVTTITQEIGMKSSQKVFHSFIGRLEDYVKIPDEFADVESEIYIFGGAAYLINWNREIAVCIDDGAMVQLLTAMITCVKEFGQRYSQNEKMKLYSPK